MVTQSDNTNTGVVATIVVVGALAMISIGALLTTMVRSAETDLDAVRPMHADLDTIAGLDQQQIAALHAAPHWVDKTGGKLGIPIERAMKLVLADVRKDPGAATPPIPPGLVLPPTPVAEGAAGAGGAAPGAVAPVPAGPAAPVSGVAPASTAVPVSGAAPGAAAAAAPVSAAVPARAAATAPASGAAPAPAGAARAPAGAAAPAAGGAPGAAPAPATPPVAAPRSP